MSEVTIVGLGYVGFPLAVRAVEVGHTVTGVDLDTRRLEALRSGHSYVEDVSDERLDAALKSGRFLVADDVPQGFEVAIIAVPTPMRGSEPDLSYVGSAGKAISRGLTRGAAVVLESTTYPGTTEGLLADALADSGLTSDEFHLGFSPERVDPGNRVHTLVNTPKLVSATTEAGLAVIQAFYDTIVDTTVAVSSPRVAELAKVFENTQAYVNIGLVNELADICHRIGIDVHEMIEAAMTKGHSMSAWYPGPGVGGHCLPVDPLYLAWQTREQLGQPFRFAELAHEINVGRPEYVAHRAEDLLGGSLAGQQVLVLGVAYKPDVADMRESPALDVVENLRRRGASVTVVDPWVDDWTLTAQLPLEGLYEALSDYPLTIVVTHHAAFDYERIAATAPLVLDTRNTMPASATVVPL